MNLQSEDVEIRLRSIVHLKENIKILGTVDLKEILAILKDDQGHQRKESNDLSLEVTREGATQMCKEDPEVL